MQQIAATAESTVTTTCYYIYCSGVKRCFGIVAVAGSAQEADAAYS
jgi:hypothetical protein